MSERMNAVKSFFILTGVVLLIFACFWFGADRAHAEGSRELVENRPAGSGPYRPYLGWRPWSTNMGIVDRTTFHVYVKSGEKIYLGSSVHNSYIDTDAGETAGQQWDIVVTSPNGTLHRLDVLNGGVGHIDTLAKEAAGPAALYAGGYDPLVIDADETGWWTVEFHGEKNQHSVGSLDPQAKYADEPWGTQNATIAAWDVTVADADGNEKKGRMYSTMLSINTGWANAPVYSRFYVLTKDGYLYNVNLNGIKPYGFIVFANNRGFIDKTTGETLRRSVQFVTEGGSTSIPPAANIMYQIPSHEDDEDSMDITHRIFLNKPNSDLPADWLTPLPVPEPDDVAFLGRTDHKAVAGEGGTFRFHVNAATGASFQLIIDADKDGLYEAGDAGGDIVIDSVALPGLNEVFWDGKYKNGTVLPVGHYNAKIMMKGGEYHFPMFDVESAENGIIIEALNAPGPYPDGKNRFFIYYNDTSYTTGSGFYMDLDGAGAPNPRDASDGVDSSGGAHKFTNNYGDEKGIDTWTYFPGPEAVVSFSVMNGPQADDPGPQTVQEDGSVDISLSGSDTETDAENLVFVIVKQPEHGTVDLTGHNATYRPDADYNGPDSFQFVAVDEDGVESLPVLVLITVIPVNDAPAAAAQTVETDEDEDLVITLSGSDKETGVGDLVYAIVDHPEHGTVDLAGRTVTYKPNADYNGPDRFTFTVTDLGDGADGPQTSAPAEVTITVKAVNDAPTATAQAVDTDEDEPLVIVLSGSDKETDVDDLVYAIVDHPEHGTVDLAGRTVTYKPDADYNGPDRFTFTVTDLGDGADGPLASAPAEVTITVRAVNDVPVAVSQHVVTTEDTPIAIVLSGTDVEDDPDDLTYALSSDPMHGTGTLTGRVYTYTPSPFYNGNDSFAFTVTDSVYSTSAPAVVTISIVSVNNEPVAIDQHVDTDEDTPVSIQLAGWDDELAADDLTYGIVAYPAHGTLSGTRRDLRYEPDPDFHGIDTFSFTVTDSVYTSAPGTVAITVHAVNDRPVAADQNLTTRRNKDLDILLVGTDVETPADQLVFHVIQGPEHGTLNGTGKEWVYAPNPGFVGTDQFLYTVTDLGDGADGPLTSLPATVTIAVTTVPTPPPHPEPEEEEIPVDVETGGSLPGIRVVQTTIQRTHLPDGTAHDRVQLNEKEITEAMLRLDEAGSDTARVILPDEEDIVTDTFVDVPQASLQKFIDHEKHLELQLEHVSIEVPFQSMEGFGRDLYFRIVPIKDEETRMALLQRAGSEEQIAAQGGDEEIRILGRPMKVETNMQNRPVTIALPLYDELPEDEAKRQAILDNLVIYIEHSDGTKEVIQGTVTGYGTGEDPGISFVMDKFSTFTMIYWSGARDYFAGGGDGQLPFDLGGRTGYVSGYPDGTFRPDHPITRAEMAVILAKNVHLPERDGSWPAFPDVSDDHWALAAIRPVTEAGLMIGYPDGSFLPGNPITRAEMAIIALKMSGLAEATGATFSDTGGHWASGAIEALAADGLLSGYPDGSFKPSRPLTRAEAVVVLNRLLGIAPLAGELEPTWPDVPATHWAFREIEAATERKLELDPLP